MFDGHCHLDRRFGDPRQAMNYLIGEAKKAGIEGMLLMNVPDIDYDNTIVLDLARSYGDFVSVFVCLNPKDVGSVDKIALWQKMGASGIKLHPRIHHYSVEDNACCAIIQKAGDLGLPVLVDCFPMGDNIALNNLPAAFARLAQKSPQTRIAIGHAGGHYMMDAVMVAKYYKNIFLDISFSLLFYKNFLVIRDMAYMLECCHYDRVFWGTDYPDREYKQTVDMSLEQIKSFSLTAEQYQALLSHNVIRFLKG